MADPAPAPATGVGGALPDREFAVEARTQWQLVLRRFLAHKMAVVSLVIFLLLVLTSLFGGHFWKYKVDSAPTSPPSHGPWLHNPLGTDDIGRDELALVLRGAQRSMQIALLVTALSTTFGATLGAIAGYYRGVLDSTLMRFTDLVLTVPLFAILAVLSHIAAGGSWLVIPFVLAALQWTTIARVVRGSFLSLREKEFVEAARALGASDRRIIFRHLLPNTTGPIIVNATVIVAIAILLETALSYVGLGVHSPDTSLGLLVQTGQAAAQTRPWLFYFPGLMIIIIALTINFIGDGLRDAFDPTQTRVRA